MMLCTRMTPQISSTDTNIHKHCKQGSIESVRYLLSEGLADVNTRGKNGRTPIMVAACDGNRSLLQLLLRKGADLLHVDDNGNNILHAACLGGDLEMVRFVLKLAFVDINSSGTNGRTPVMLAARKGYKKIFDLLVNTGCDLSQVSGDGDNILHHACLGGYLDIVKYILQEQIVDINSRGKYGRTPVMKAAWGGHKRVLNLLVDKGGDISMLDNESDNIIHVACIRGNVAMVKNILAKHIFGINSRGRKGRTPLMVAAQYGKKELFNLLLCEGANMFHTDDDGNNILHVSCIGGHLHMVVYVLSGFIFDINSRGKSGRTPAMLAAQEGHKHVFNLIVSRNCNLQLGDSCGNNFIHIACIGGSVEMVNYLLRDNTAAIESRGRDGRTPIMSAAAHGQTDVVKLLMSKGSDVTLLDDYGESILHIACSGGRVDMLTFILSLGHFDINSRGRFGRTPVMVAAERGHRQVLDFLVSEGGDVSFRDTEDDSILHVACVGGDVEMVKHLLQMNVFNINSRGKYGRTPVMLAAEFGHIELFYFLVCRGGDLMLVDDNGDSILHVACGGNVKMVKCLLSLDIIPINSRGCRGNTPIMASASRGHKAVFEMFVKNQADLSLVNEDGNNVLHIACIHGSASIVNLLLLKHAVDINGRGKYGRTPVMLAAEFGHSNVFELLVQHGADVRLRDDDGNNILHISCSGDNVTIINLVLVNHMADINSRGHNGRTSLMWAVERGQMGVFNFLVRKGADVTLVDDDGDNVLHVASVVGDADMVKHIISKNVVDINATNHQGLTAEMIAKQESHTSVMSVFSSAAKGRKSTVR
ncbi:serine/threonine-protein phosphatase 6 regulatory ankyrin repeat subunit A-like [Haliotis asinina]|uniref:serine/threonine-protein phosphatase 6 regulatory ankyrin repeat subunit A-like n=1 Tax=Haliotis asinina TaxID=109174 RepID=UPI0035322DFD